MSTPADNLLSYTAIPLENEDNENNKIIHRRFKKRICNCCYLNCLHLNFKMPLKNALFMTFMLIYTGVYLTSETIQSSSLISSSSHSNNTVFSYAYDLLFTWLITYVLTSRQMITLINTEHNSNTFLYFICCNAGAIIFALLGETKIFKDFAISGDFWKHLNPPEAIVLSIVMGIIVAIGIKEYLDIRNTKRIFYRNIFNLFLVSCGYFLILYMLMHCGAKGIHYHVHHAIFSGVLSMWFTLWKNPFEQIMHAVLLGICIEGINFYQLQEFYLFLVNQSVEMSYDGAAAINVIYLLLSFVLSLFSFII